MLQGLISYGYSNAFLSSRISLFYYLWLLYCVPKKKSVFKPAANYPLLCWYFIAYPSRVSSLLGGGCRMHDAKPQTRAFLRERSVLSSRCRCFQWTSNLSPLTSSLTDLSRPEFYIKAQKRIQLDQMSPRTRFQTITYLHSYRQSFSGSWSSFRAGSTFSQSAACTPSRKALESGRRLMETWASALRAEQERVRLFQRRN